MGKFGAVTVTQSFPVCHEFGIHPHIFLLSKDIKKKQGKDKKRSQ